MTFLGFSFSSSQQWPPELAALLPYLKFMSELKALLFVLDACIQAQLEPVPLTVDQVQRGTGLARQSTVTGLQLALAHGLLERTPAGLTFAYSPRLAVRTASRLQCVCNMNHNHMLTMEQTHTLESNTRTQSHRLYRLLVEEFKVAAPVAENILLTHDLDMVQRQIDFARAEIERGGIRRRAGYVVARIRENWEPPEASASPIPSRSAKRGGPGKREEARQRWYTDEEFEIFFEHPPDMCSSSGEEGDMDGADGRPEGEGEANAYPHA